MVEGHEGRSFREVSNAERERNKSALNLAIGKLLMILADWFSDVFRQATCTELNEILIKKY